MEGETIISEKCGFRKLFSLFVLQKHKMHPGHFAVVFGSGSGACQDGGLPDFISEKNFTKMIIT